MTFAAGAWAASQSAGHGGDEAADSDAAAEDNGAQEEGEEHGGVKAGWAYSGKKGPQAWGKISAEFRACKSGRMQSPIDLGTDARVSASAEAIEFDYHLTPLRILHNGHTVQVNYEPGSGITVGGKRYELLQFHFHGPSEHVVDGRPAALEMHLVHMSADGELAVVGVLMDAGAENRALSEVWASMPKRATAERVSKQVLVNARDLLPSDTAYYRYMGSLTTPPCSEGVSWYVLEQRLEVSAQQIGKFAKAVGANARPAQALNQRLLVAPTGIN